MPKTDAQRSRERRERKRRGERLVSVPLMSGQMLVVLDAGLVADVLTDVGAVKDWDAENVSILSEAVVTALQNLKRHA